MKLLTYGVLVVGGLFGSVPAFAANWWTDQAAAGNCVGPLPSYDSNLRKRPGGILNEGSADAFLSCGLSNDPIRLTWGVDVQLTYRGPSSASARCTLVSGFNTANVSYISDERTISSMSNAYITFRLDFSSNEHFTPPLAISCILPPGMELNRSTVLMHDPHP